MLTSIWERNNSWATRSPKSSWHLSNMAGSGSVIRFLVYGSINMYSSSIPTVNEGQSSMKPFFH